MWYSCSIQNHFRPIGYHCALFKVTSQRQIQKLLQGFLPIVDTGAHARGPMATPPPPTKDPMEELGMRRLLRDMTMGGNLALWRSKERQVVLVSAKPDKPSASSNCEADRALEGLRSWRAREGRRPAGDLYACAHKNAAVQEQIHTHRHRMALDYGSANEVQLESVWHVPLQQLFTIAHRITIQYTVTRDRYFANQIGFLRWCYPISCFHFPNSPSIFHFVLP